MSALICCFGLLAALLAGTDLPAGESQGAAPAVPAASAVLFAETGQPLNRLAGRGVALADLNGDGFLDAFVVNENTPDGQGHRVYFGDGRGHFTDSGQRLANPSNWEGKPAVGDVNGDGKLDVITGNIVWINDGRGHFEAHPEFIETSGADVSGPVKLADLDGDGHLDLVAVSGWKSLRVYLGDGRGRFRDTGQQLGSGIIGSLALGDVNGDGAVDVISGGWRVEGSDYAPSRVWLNDGKGHFTDAGPVDHGENHVHGVALGDVDGDGSLDVVMACTTPGQAGKVYLNDGKGRFRDSGQILAHRWAHSVALGDLDGDGSLDAFFACGEPQTGTPNEVWLNDGKGSFRDSGLRLGNAFSWDVALGDLSGDGRLDAVVANLRLIDGSKDPPVFGGAPAEVWLNTTPKGPDDKPTVRRSTGMRLEWTHFIGGRGEEDLGWLRSPYLDREGMLWITGTTTSPDFPVTPDALHSTYHGGNNWGMEDIFLMKFNTRRPGIAYSTFLGGAKGPEFVADLCLDRAKNVHLAGNTGSSDFPTTGDALIKEFRGPGFRHADGFLTILGDEGRKLKYSSFIGGTGNDWVLQQFIEPSGPMTLFGITDSRDFPTTEVASPAQLKKAPALFVMRLDAKGGRVLSSRLLANSWSVDVQRLDSGDFLIAGNTNNPELPTTEGAYNRRYNGGDSEAGGDIFVMRLSADLTTAFTTLFGGAGEESSPRLVEVRGGDIIVAGRTTSKDLSVTANASERTLEGKDALFLARFSGDGKRLKYCTYLGAKGEDYNSAAIAYDGKSRVYAVASTTSPRSPVTPDALCATHKGGRDGLVLVFNVDSNSIEYSSYLGGSKDDRATNLALGEDGAVYVLGYTNSDDFPALEKTPAPKKGTDIFISKFSTRTAATAPAARFSRGEPQ